MTSPTDCLYYLVSRVTLVVTAALRKALAEAGVGEVKPAYLGVLLSLWRDDGLRANVLGRRAGLEPSSVTGLVDRMEAAGLVERRPDPSDRRAQTIWLTAKGRGLEAAVVSVVDGLLAEQTEGIPEADLETTKAALRTVLGQAGQAFGARNASTRGVSPAKQGVSPPNTRPAQHPVRREGC